MEQPSFSNNTSVIGGGMGGRSLRESRHSLGGSSHSDPQNTSKPDEESKYQTANFLPGKLAALANSIGG